MKRIKPLQPSLREKKRYLALKVISEANIGQFKPVEVAILKESLSFLGVSGCADAGIMPMADRWNQEDQTAIIRVNNKFVDKVKTALAFVREIDGQEAMIACTKVSGILKKTQLKGG